MECYASPIITCYIYFFSFVKSLKFKMKKKKKKKKNKTKKGFNWWSTKYKESNQKFLMV